MSDGLDAELADHLAVIAGLRSQVAPVLGIGAAICARLDRGGVVYSFGNGGSAADAQHLAGELIGRFRRERRPLAAVALATDPSVLTCIGNDYSYADVFARQVTALARPRDVVVAFTSSGRSPNVIAGLEAAQAAGALTVLFTGGAGHAQAGAGPDATAYADHVLRVESEATARVQEGHVLLLHLLSEYIDRWAAGEEPPGR
ncbi:MAG: D-sedoheptulose-7-phosphate isomerase [Mycobacteriales bacterium]